MAKLPQTFADQIKKEPPTDTFTDSEGLHTWHEVQFQMPGNIMCQAAVLDGEEAPGLPDRDVNRILGVLRIVYLT